jgi:ComF family protein
MARAAALYEADLSACGDAQAGGTMRQAILLFKYGGRRTLARHLGRLMVEAAGHLFDPSQFDLLVPVPLHPKRERLRGFNQAELLAKEFGNGWGLAVGHGLLHRTRATEAQSGGRREREDNVKGAFQVTRPDRVQDMRLLLIDDVFTTGATAGECAKTLLTAGAAKVGVYTLARVE